MRLLETTAIQVTVTATNGIIMLAGTQGLTLGPGNGQQDEQIVMTGTIADVNAAMNGMLFRPTAQSAQLEIAANDLGHSGAGEPKTGERDGRHHADSPSRCRPILLS